MHKERRCQNSLISYIVLKSHIIRRFWDGTNNVHRRKFVGGESFGSRWKSRDPGVSWNYGESCLNSGRQALKGNLNNFYLFLVKIVTNLCHNIQTTSCTQNPECKVQAEGKLCGSLSIPVKSLNKDKLTPVRWLATCICMSICICICIYIHTVFCCIFLFLFGTEVSSRIHVSLKKVRI